MATPASDITEWDPLGPNAAAGNALVVLRPQNAAAKLAFSEVVDFIKEQDQSFNDGDGDGPPSIRSHYSQFIWFSDEQVSDPAVARLVQHRRRMESASSPSSAASSDSFPDPTQIWTGFFFLDLDVPPLITRLGWSVGRFSKKSLSLPSVDLLLTTSRSSQVARRHAFISFSKETRLACVSLDSGSSATVNDHSLTSRGGTASCVKAQNSVCFEDLRYTLEYAPHCYRSQGQRSLEVFLTAYHGDDQPTREALLATPTPTMNSQTIGKYSITAAGLIGMGAFGRVRPATDPHRDQLVAIKTIEARANNIQAVRSKIDLMDELTGLADAEKQMNILRVVEVIHMPGTRIDEFHVILEPFVEITLEKIPRDTHRTKLELILRDCLRGLSFLHAHRFVHTDIKPANIGLRNFRLNQSQTEAPSSPPFPPRPLHAVLLDIDSIEKIPDGSKSILSRPGTNGTVGFHSPEHESSEYDGKTDVWALGVSFFRALFGRLPWAYGKQGNPWRNDVPEQLQSRGQFHLKYKAALYQISDQFKVHGDPLCNFLIASFRFPDAEIGSQREPRPTSADCLRVLFEQSEFLTVRASNENQETDVSMSNAGSGSKRPAESEEGQPARTQRGG